MDISSNHLKPYSRPRTWTHNKNVGRPRTIHHSIYFHVGYMKASICPPQRLHLNSIHGVNLRTLLVFTQLALPPIFSSQRRALVENLMNQGTTIKGIDGHVTLNVCASFVLIKLQRLAYGF